MSSLLWEEFARLQRLATNGIIHDEQLDAFLVRYCDQNHIFDLRECRRRQKNLGRNLSRRKRDRQSLLRRESQWLVCSPIETPVTILLRRELRATLRQAASEDLELL